MREKNLKTIEGLLFVLLFYYGGYFYPVEAER